MICDVCGLALAIGQFPCITTIRPHGVGVPSVIGDEIDEWNENVAHEPVHFTSRGEKRRYLAEHGLQEFVRHVGSPGSDKSPHTQRWI